MYILVCEQFSLVPLLSDIAMAHGAVRCENNVSNWDDAHYG